MKRRTIVGVTLGLAAVLALSGAALAFSGISNGSFESGQYGGGGFQELSTGSTTITGWTVTAGNVDWVDGSYWGAADGSKSVDLDGSAAGAVSQTLATTIGDTYVVEFSLAGNPEGNPAVKTRPRRRTPAWAGARSRTRSSRRAPARR